MNPSAIGVTRYGGFKNEDYHLWLSNSFGCLVNSGEFKRAEKL